MIVSHTVNFERNKHAIRTARCLGKCDVDSLVDDLDSAPWNVMDSLEDVDRQWEYCLFEKIVESHAPTKKARVKRKSV